MKLLEFKEYSAYYRKKKIMTVALDRISLSVEQGEFLIVVGPSGCGKTTLLKSLTDGIEYTDGEIFLEGEPLFQVPLGKRNIAYISQECNLVRSQSIFDSIAFPLRMMGVRQEETVERVKELASVMGLLPFLTRRPKQLSGGQLQRAELCRALIKHPRLILFDEPFSNLDPELRASMREYLKAVHKRYRPTCIFVTHDLNDAYHLAGRILVLNRGAVEQIGTAQEILSHPATDFVRGFFDP